MIAFIRRWGWFALVLLGAALSLLFLRRNPGKAIGAVSDELKSIQKEAEIEKLSVEQGRDAALAEVEKHYAEQKQALNIEQAQKAKTLAQDPAALARFLARVGRR